MNMMCSLKKIAACMNLVFLLLLSQQLLSMDNLKTDISSNVLSLVIYNKPLYFHHKDICSLALVNKESQKAIQDTAWDRRRHLEALDPKGPVTALRGAPLTWDKHGSMCAARGTTWYSDTHSSLELCCFTYNYDTVGVMCSEDFSYYPRETKSECQPFFNRVGIDEKGGIFCYDLSFQNDKCLMNSLQIVEYSCSKNEKSRKRQCVIAIKESSWSYALSHFIPFPSLLKALLQAPIVQQDDHCKVYDLSKAIIPDDYQRVDQNYGSLHTFEKDLPEELRNAIIKRYQQQKKK